MYIHHLDADTRGCALINKTLMELMTHLIPYYVRDAANPHSHHDYGVVESNGGFGGGGGDAIASPAMLQTR